MLTATLNGFLPEDYDSAQPLSGPVGIPTPGMTGRTVAIGDARALQSGAASEAAFFEEHGFVLLQHRTEVRDWDADVPLYLSELDQVIRERLLPGKRLSLDLYPQLLRRGRGTGVPFYAEGVHSDGGRDARAFVANIGAFAGPAAEAWWLERYAQDDVAGVIWIDFWRVTNMTEPLRHMPLALCDVSTLDAGDLIDTRLTGIAPEGRETQHLSLRFSAGQRWYYYPGMTGDEMLAFKLAEFWKGSDRPGNCFHSAFRDAGAPADAQERQSCEYRAGVMVLKDA